MCTYLFCSSRRYPGISTVRLNERKDRVEEGNKQILRLCVRKHYDISVSGAWILFRSGK